MAWLPLTVMPKDAVLGLTGPASHPSGQLQRRPVLSSFWPTAEPVCAPPAAAGRVGNRPACLHGLSTLPHRNRPSSLRLAGEPAAHDLQGGRAWLAVAPGSYAMKRPKRAMVGAWSGLDNRPARPASSTATEEPSYTAGPHRRRRPNDRSNPGPAQQPGPPHERDAPWQPNPAARPQPPIPGYLSTGQVADLLYVSPKTVSRWAKDGKLPFMKTLGGHRRYPEAKIRELANELREEPTV